MGIARNMAALALALAAGSVEARIVTIQNASFETPVLVDNGFVFGVPSWTNAGVDTGVFNPPVGAYPGQAPDGANVAFISFNSAPTDALSQVLAETLLPNTTYQLQADFGVRTDAGTPVGGSVVLELYAGSTLLASATPALPAPGNFTTATAFVAIGASHPALGQPLVVRLVGNIPNGGQFNFDDVVLQAGTTGAVPALDPAALALLALLVLGGGILAARRWA